MPIAEHPLTVWLMTHQRSGRWLAGQLGVDPSLVSRWLRGLRPMPRSALARLASLTGDDAMRSKVTAWQKANKRGGRL